MPTTLEKIEAIRRRAIEIDNDCPSHGNSEKAKERFWKSPWTCHWACKCKGIKSYEFIK